MIEISVLIVTKNREKKLLRCLDSILKDNFDNFEIVIIDQNRNNRTSNLIKKISSGKIRYFKLVSDGKSKGLNFGIKACLGDIIAFTDDDCIVSKDWLMEISTFLKREKKVVGVFGQSLPYNPNGHKNEICISTFKSKNRKYFHNHRIIHYKELGLGNNMAFYKDIFYKVGLFREWLGPGVNGMAGGEEGEFIYRALKSSYLLAFEPKIVIYHDNWMSYHQEQIIQGKYSSGALAFYGYYLGSDLKLFKALIKNRIAERLISKVNIIFSDLIKLQFRRIFRSRMEFVYIIWEQACMLRGFTVGMYHQLTV